jgi:major intracellular serine protease
MTALVETSVAALLALGAAAAPAAAADVPLPTAQATAMYAEFLAQAPPPATPGVTCIVDTGVKSNPDTDAAVIDRQTVYPGDGSDGDTDAHHGTYLAMNIAAPANGWGMVGIAPQTRVLSVRAIDNGAHTFQSWAYRLGLEHCWQAKANQGINVTTALLALGHADTDSSSDGQQVEREITFLRANGISVVAAVGNDGGAVQWPARYGPVFTVGASDGGGAFCPSASRGAALDLSALGCGDDSALWDSGDPAAIEGSSTSAGLVAGVITALRAYKPELTPDQAEQLLVSTSDNASAGKVVNVAEAFRAAGLEVLVNMYQRPLPVRPPKPAVITVGTICPDGGVLSCQRPKLVSGNRRSGKVTLTVAFLPTDAVLQGRVNRRWHTSKTRSITIRAKKWKRILLRFVSFGGERSRTLIVGPRELRHHPRR